MDYVEQYEYHREAAEAHLGKLALSQRGVQANAAEAQVHATLALAAAHMIANERTSP